MEENTLTVRLTMTGAATSILIACLALLLLPYRNVETYMDEIFHVPQAQKYCAGNFLDWDSKITTFPGLYLLSSTVHRVLSSLNQQLMGHDIECSIDFLRVVNMCLGMISFFLYRSCRLKVEPTGRDATVIAFLLFLYPVNFFYYFLFYTDTASTLSIVVVYYLVLSHPVLEIQQNTTPKSNGQSAEMTGVHGTLKIGSWYLLRYWTRQFIILIAAVSSVMMRQTNAVWTLFIAGSLMLSLLQRIGEFRDSHSFSVGKLLEFVRKILWNLPYLLSVSWPLLAPVAAFVVFVVVNKGIVVGDKNHHVPVYHLAMPLHACVAFTALLTPVWAVSAVSAARVWAIAERRCVGGVCEIGAGRRTVWPRISLLSCACHVFGVGVVACVLHFHCLSHPFLLADNRLLLSPLYYCCALWTVTHLMRARGFIATVILAAAVVLTLVPAHLFELRYFSPAVVIAVISSLPAGSADVVPCYSNPAEGRKEKNLDLERQSSARSPLLISVCAVCVVNALTVYIFLYKHFTWVDGAKARFMY